MGRGILFYFWELPVNNLLNTGNEVLFHVYNYHQTPSDMKEFGVLFKFENLIKLLHLENDRSPWEIIISLSSAELDFGMQ